MDDWMTIKNVAPMIGVSREWLIRNREVGPPYHKRGARRVYSRDEVMAWVETQRGGGRRDKD